VQAVVLCGGRGSRLYPASAEVPKPLLAIRSRPILAHLLDIYAAQGVTSFVLAAGFGVEQVEQFAAGLPEQWSVLTVDTGLDTGTGARIRACLDHLEPTFFATYGDGLGNVDLTALHRRHCEHGGGATLTSVPLPSQYGTLELGPDDAVSRFVEKPVLADHWINAGFFVFDAEVYAAQKGDDLERDVLPALATAGHLHVYRHGGFWKSMDTAKDLAELDRLADAAGDDGVPPWLT
jgi:glucose-1-phosphate cytidylyltransferase